MGPAGQKECNSRSPKQLYACDVSAITAREAAKAMGAVQEVDGGLLNLESTVLSAQSWIGSGVILSLIMEEL